MRRLKWGVLALAGFMAACEAEGNGDGAMEAVGDEEIVLGSPLACEPTATGSALAERSSPYDSTDLRINGVEARICYSRPFLRGRSMIGGDAVPFDTIWRTGANEPTIINLDGPARLAGVEVDAGSYSLYTIPRSSGPWTLIVNASTSQWGHESRYTEEVREQEVGRAEISVEAVEETVDQLTIRPVDEGGPGFVIEWQNSRVTVPVEPAQ